MIESLIPLSPPPGIYRQGTDYEAKGRWADANLVRFTEDTIRPVGGWRRMLDSTFTAFSAITGVARGALAWRGEDGTTRIAIGTNTNLYLISGKTMHDITPSGFTTGNIDSGPTGGGGSWGDGAWGAGPWGGAASGGDSVDAATWQLDNFGDFAVGVCTSDLKLYVWEGDPATAAIFPTATGGTIPDAKAVVVTPERFVMLLKGDTVSWADQESYVDWDFASVTNQAGQQPLATNGALVAGRRGRGETYLWTDMDMWVATYLGLPEVYSFRQVGDHCGLIAPNAVAIVDGRALWMGNGKFYKYDGAVAPIRCDVADFLFSNLNRAQLAKIHAKPYTQFGEIWFFYPSLASSEIDSYVIYNYIEDHWCIGTQTRTAGVTDGPTEYPVLVDDEGLIWEHEFGNDRGDEVPFLTSGPIDTGNEEIVKHFQRIVPDEKVLGQVNATLYTSFFPTELPYEHGPYTLTAPTSVRCTGRQLRVRFTEAVANTAWRIGKMRLGYRVGGRR